MNVFDASEKVELFRCEVEEWLGTPFIAHTCIKRVGADCVTFAHGVLHSLGHLPAVTWPRYAIRGTDDSGFRLICENVEKLPGVTLFFSQSLEERLARLPDGLMPGDMLVFSTGRAVHHTGLYVESGRFAHCTLEAGVILSWLADSTFYRHLKRVYRLVDMGESS